eukprot:6199568-Pleurochrysis_carterae.AAC.1
MCSRASSTPCSKSATTGSNRVIVATIRRCAFRLSPSPQETLSRAMKRSRTRLCSQGGAKRLTKAALQERQHRPSSASLD